MISEHDIQGMKEPTKVKVGDIITVELSNHVTIQGEVEVVNDCGSVKLKGMKYVVYPL